MGTTKIPWADRVWNPVTGCTKVSAGCNHCYAHAMHARFGKGPFKVTFHPDRLSEPLRWRRPSRVFVASMGDLFHVEVPTATIIDVLDVIRDQGQHTFMVLTKRPERMREILSLERYAYGELSNVWRGVSVEDQRTADERIPILLQTPAAVRFVSAEPLLGPVAIERWLEPLGQDTCINCGAEDRHYLSASERDALKYTNTGDALCSECGDMRTATGDDPGLDWVIAGCESGPGARPCDPLWVCSIINQCEAANVPLFVKQWQEYPSTPAPKSASKLVKMPMINGKVYDQFPKP